MNFVKKILFNQVNLLYCLITIMMLSTIAMLSPITTNLNILILLWAAIYFIYDFFNKKSVIKSRYKKLLIIYMLCFLISIILNIENNFIDNVKTFAYTGLFLFVIYSYDYNKSLNKIKSELINFNNIIITISSLTGFASLLTFVFFIQFTYNEIPQGFVYPDSPALWGFYSNPNSGGMIAVLSIVLTIANIYLYKFTNKKNSSKLRNKYYIVNIILQWLYLVLCNSRGAVLSLLASILFLSFYLCYTKFKIKFSIFKSLLISLIVSGFVFIGYNSILSVSKFSLSYIPEFVQNIRLNNTTTNNNTNIENNGSTIKLDRDIKEGHVSTGRVEIWTYGLNTLKFSPLFGYGPSNIGLEKQKLYPNDTSRYIVTNNMHNGYIQILLSNGIIGSIFFLLFIILLAKDSVICLLKNKVDINSSEKKLIFIILLPIVAISVNGLFENVILLTQSYITTILWTYLGYLSLNIDKIKQ